jgi:hypothetical protein
MRALLAAGCLFVCVSASAAPATESSRVAESEAPAPSDVRVEMKKGQSGRWNVTFRRNGYFVALRIGERTSAARNAVTVEIDGPPGSAIELGWEATDGATLDTSRGGIRMTATDEGPAVSCFALPPAAVVGTNRGQLHECRAFEYESRGFAVVCRIANGARKLSALNLTGDAPLSGVATSGESLVRLDLPVGEGGAEARLIGYLTGSTAVVVRAEATWVRGEERPTLSLASGTRRQLVAPRLTRPDIGLDFLRF